MLSSSQFSSLVAWDLTGNHRIHQQMPRVLQRLTSSKRAIHPDSTSRLPMAEGSYRSLSTEGRHHHHCGLLLTISRDHPAEIHNILFHHKCPKIGFGRHGIPETLVIDNGPQYRSYEFTVFAKAYGITHKTSSPHYPQSNGLAERMFKTIKSLFIESPDKALALLSYRSTPLPWCGLSPAQLCMGRQLRTDVPQTSDKLTPEWNFLQKFKNDEKKFKEHQEKDYNRRHRTHSVPAIPAGTGVWITTDEHNAEGVANPDPTAPRSYTVTTSSRTVRRNRSRLRVIYSKLNSTNIFDRSTNKPYQQPILVAVVCSLGNMYSFSSLQGLACRNGSHRHAPIGGNITAIFNSI